MKRKFLAMVGLLLTTTIYGQNQFVNKEQVESKFIKIESGFNAIIFRDMATSPLYYTGFLSHVGLSFIKLHDGKEREFGWSLSTGLADNSTNSHVASSTVSIYGLKYSKLYPLWSNEKMNLKIGGELNNKVHVRQNPSFQNNGTGMEIFTTLFATGKLSWDISNTRRKQVKLLLLPMNFKPRKRDISFNLKLAVSNNTFRNGYAYSSNSGITNNIGLWDDYEFKMFSGYRIGSEFNYTVFFENKNALRIGYEFDTYKTGGNLDKFGMANHKLTIALLFKTK